MKKCLTLILASMLCLASFAKSIPAWDKPLKVQSIKTFEDVTILWYSPEYYPADYWYTGQAAGYFLFLSLEGVQWATWELTIGIETNNGMKIFTFTVPGGSGTNWHDHVLEMSSQMAPGETIPEAPQTDVIHWWIVS